MVLYRSVWCCLSVLFCEFKIQFVCSDVSLVEFRFESMCGMCVLSEFDECESLDSSEIRRRFIHIFGNVNVTNGAVLSEDVSDLLCGDISG